LPAAGRAASTARGSSAASSPGRRCCCQLVPTTIGADVLVRGADLRIRGAARAHTGWFLPRLLRSLAERGRPPDVRMGAAFPRKHPRRPLDDPSRRGRSRTGCEASLGDASAEASPVSDGRKHAGRVPPGGGTAGCSRASRGSAGWRPGHRGATPALLERRREGGGAGDGGDGGVTEGLNRIERLGSPPAGDRVTGRDKAGTVNG
jgi:hypothetical protein